MGRSTPSMPISLGFLINEMKVRKEETFYHPDRAIRGGVLYWARNERLVSSAWIRRGKGLILKILQKRFSY